MVDGIRGADERGGRYAEMVFVPEMHAGLVAYFDGRTEVRKTVSIRDNSVNLTAAIGDGLVRLGKKYGAEAASLTLFMK